MCSIGKLNDYTFTISVNKSLLASIIPHILPKQVKSAVNITMRIIFNVNVVENPLKQKLYYK
jgi:hypothetical protein